jgi:hypothetical protein
MRTFSAAAASLAVLCLLSFAYAQQTGTPARNSSDPTAPPSAAKTNLDAQFAETMYQLAAARLDRVKNLDRRSTGAVAPGDIMRMELQVQALSHLQEAARRDGKLEWFNMLLSEAEMSRAFADASLKRLTSIQSANPALVSGADLEIAALAAKMAELNFQRGKEAAAKSHEDQQNWGLQFLLLDAQTMQDRIHLLEFRL